MKEINLTGAMTKGGKQRHVYLTNPRVVGAIRDFLGDRQEREGILFNLDAPLFKSQKGSSFSPDSLQQLFHRMYFDAKLQGASMMGHSSIAMTAKYVENNPARLKQICTALF